MSTLAGSGAAGYADGIGARAIINRPFSITVDARGNAFVSTAPTEQDDSRIRVIDPSGVVSTLTAFSGIRGFADGSPSSTLFDAPLGLTLDPSGTNLWIADAGNNRIRVVSITSGLTNTLIGGGAGMSFADGSASVARFSNPKDVVSWGGALYVADTSSHLVRKVVCAASASPSASSGPSAPTMTATPSPAPLLSCTTSTFAGSPPSAGFTDSVGRASFFNHPVAVAIDTSAGRLIVADTDGNRIRVISLSDARTFTLVGTGSSSTFVDGTGAVATVSGPQGVAVDASGYIYVAGECCLGWAPTPSTPCAWGPVIIYTIHTNYVAAEPRSLERLTPPPLPPLP